LKTVMEQPVAHDASIGRVAILGIGHELRGDDAVGLEVARQLQNSIGRRPGLMVIETGPVPENYTSRLRRFRPDLVVLVDAAIMGERPGTVCSLDWQNLGGITFSSHALSLQLLASYLNAELNCQVNIIGIQPENNTLHAPLSPTARQAVTDAIEMIKKTFLE